MFCCGYDDFIVEFRQILKIKHRFKNRIIKRHDDKILAVTNLFEEFPEIEGEALFVKDTQGFSKHNRRYDNDIFSQLAVCEDLDRFPAELGTIGEPPDKGMCIRYKVHEKSDIDRTVQRGPCSINVLISDIDSLYNTFKFYKATA